MAAFIKPTILAALLCAFPASVPAHVPSGCDSLLDTWSVHARVTNRALEAEPAARKDELLIRAAGRDATEAQAAVAAAELDTKHTELAEQELFPTLLQCLLDD